MIIMNTITVIRMRHQSLLGEILGLRSTNQVSFWTVGAFLQKCILSSYLKESGSHFMRRTEAVIRSTADINLDVNV